jgi:hypothetical protein
LVLVALVVLGLMVRRDQILYLAALHQLAAAMALGGLLLQLLVVLAVLVVQAHF